MSAPFVNCRVKVTGTSKPELNDQEGRALSYNTETMRYSVQLDNGRTVALKVVNLLQIGDGDAGGGDTSGGFPGMPTGMPDMAQALNILPPWLRAKLSRGELPSLDDLKQLLPNGVTAMHVGSVAAMFVLMVMKFGLFKTTLLFAILGFMLYSGFRAFSSSGGGIEGVKAAGHAIGQKLSDLILAKTQKNIPAHLSLGALVALLVAVMCYIFLTSGSPAHGPLGGAPFRPPGGSLTAADAYDRGFDDAIAGKAHDWAAHADSFRAASYTPAPEYYSAPVQQSSGMFGGFGIGKLFSLGILGKQLYSLGAIPGGGWDKDFAIANFANQSNMQKGLMLFMVLRLVGMSPI